MPLRATAQGLALLCLGTAAAAPLPAQPRRDPAVRHPGALEDAVLLVGSGLVLEEGFRNPVSGFEGDLLSLPRITLAWAPASTVVVGVRGDLRRRLVVERVTTPAIPLAPEVADGTAEDWGDFEVTAAARVLGGGDGGSVGVRFRTRLPNSDERRGIGLNTTDFHLGLVGGWSGGRAWRADVALGIGILEAPLERFEQNDVLEYAAAAEWRPDGSLWRLVAELEGRASTRGRVPPGTEDRGEVRVGADLETDGWLFDAAVGKGWAELGPSWTLRAGVARLLRGGDAGPEE